MDKMIDKGSEFIAFDTLVILYIVQKMEISQNVSNSRSSHNISHTGVTIELSTLPINFCCW